MGQKGQGLFNMKKGIKEFPGNIFNLAKRPSAEKDASRVKVSKGFIYLFLIFCLACLQNTCTAAGESVKFSAVKNCPVNIAPLHDTTEIHGNGGVVTSNKVSHGGGRNFFDLLFEELNSASPGEASPKEVGNGKNHYPILTELSTNIDKLCHILLAYFIPAAMFFISVPALIFYWARGALKMDRESIEVIKYNFSEAKKQVNPSASEEINK